LGGRRQKVERRGGIQYSHTKMQHTLAANYSLHLHRFRAGRKSRSRWLLLSFRDRCHYPVSDTVTKSRRHYLPVLTFYARRVTGFCDLVVLQIETMDGQQTISKKKSVKRHNPS
jgi:hypothetical protein